MAAAMGMTWYRAIDFRQEINTLAIRKHLTDEDLSKDIIPPEGYPNSHVEQGFTPVSAFQYLTSELKFQLFIPEEDAIGILVCPRQDKPRKVLWRNSNRAASSDEVFKVHSKIDDFRSKLRDNDFEVFNENEIFSNLKDRYERIQNEHKKYQKECKRDSVDCGKPIFGWTEGLFRYKIIDISGVVINPESTESCINGLALRLFVSYINNAKLPVYQLNESNYPAQISSSSLGLKPHQKEEIGVIFENLKQRFPF